MPPLLRQIGASGNDAGEDRHTTQHDCVCPEPPLTESRIDRISSSTCRTGCVAYARFSTDLGL